MSIERNIGQSPVTPEGATALRSNSSSVVISFRIYSTITGDTKNRLASIDYVLGLGIYVNYIIIKYVK